MMTRVLIPTMLILISLVGVNAQNIELDFTTGLHIAKPNFHHSSRLEINSGNRYQNYNNAYFKIGLTAPILKNALYLETELGYIGTNVFYSISYDYDDGFQELYRVKVTYLSNQKLYWSIAPEYRYHLGPVSLRLNGGLVMAKDISNTMSSYNEVHLTKRIPEGFKIGAGLQFLYKNIGVKYDLTYMSFGESQLQNRHHPTVSYKMLIMRFGLVCRI